MHLPGLAPGGTALVALARTPAAAWEQVRVDPGALLLLARTSATGSLVANLGRDANIVDEALRLLDRAPFVDWSAPEIAPIYQASLTYAMLSARLAERTQRCNPQRAWTAGLLAPLGWLAVCALFPESIKPCLESARLQEDAGVSQRQLWGIDQAAIARRLNRRWRLPSWLTTVTGHLDLPAADAEALGADPTVFRVAQLAVALVQRDGGGLQLPVGTTPTENATALEISAGDWIEIGEMADSVVNELPAMPIWESPSGMPLLRDLLTQVADNRRRADDPALRELESEVDHLHRALSEQRAGEEKRVRDQKLTALAEFAAGAGHEINNPLAVISGHAQYLLGDETDPVRQRSLQIMIQQAQRIHQILTGLMQFSRPTRPQKQLLDLPLLVRDVTAELADLAEQRHVRLTCELPEAPVSSLADPRQLRLALACLVRNAVEAAPSDGWATVRMETPGPDQVEVIVEDSGSGPTPAQREHLFDPFYSGRQAGRGRGLGLATAWRLAREHGGDVRFEDLPQGPTRFVLALPRPSVEPVPRCA
jgi:signal transduction histidine kinase